MIPRPPTKAGNFFKTHGSSGKKGGGEGQAMTQIGAYDLNLWC